MNVTSPTAERGQLRSESALMDVKQVASLLGCSQRHIYRLCNAKQMPQPIHLRSLVRWNRPQLEEWIANGCPEPISSDETSGVVQ